MMHWKPAVVLLTALLTVLFALYANNRNEKLTNIWRTQADTVDSRAMPAPFDWSSVVATSHLAYSACYDGFECARLEVPVDWTNISNSNKAPLAIIRLPASVPDTDPSFGGTILVSPGGPGGSGIDVLRWTGHGIRDIVDGDKKFEILSWDPRGMHHTTPSISCFEDRFQEKVWSYRKTVLGPMDASNTSLFQKWQLAKALGDFCARSNVSAFPDGSNMAQFTTTALVARDMLEIIDQVEAHRLKAGGDHKSESKQQGLRGSTPALLNYWGYSYGSYLGNTFASMFPARIGRMVLDSVVDTEDYTATGWFGALQDYDKVLETFCKDCFEAKELCALSTSDVASPKDVCLKITGLLDSLKAKPIVCNDNGPNVVTFADVSPFLFSAMYYPTWSWPELAQILADLLQSNTTSMLPHLTSLGGSRGSNNEHNIDRQLFEGRNQTQAYPPLYPGELEAGINTMCSDGEDISHLTVDDWRGRLASWTTISPIVGWIWSEHTMHCVHWPKAWRPASRNRFTGPWTTKLAEYDSRASPLLFVGGTADPVLPLTNAYKAAAQHEGARVLIQDAPGHCSGYVNPVPCTWMQIRNFFTEGVLPENNTICKRNATPWSRK